MIVKLLAIGLLASLAAATHLQYPITGEACILINLTANNSLEWKPDNATYNVPKWSFADSNVIDGNCSGDKPYLEVKWDVDNATMKFEFSKTSGKAQVGMTLSFVPQVVFVKDNNTDNSTQELSVSYTLGSAEKAFKCITTQSKTATNESYSMTLRIGDLMIQGYNVKDGKYSDYEECGADPTPTPYPTPTPFPAPVPQVLDKVYLNATDGNITCAMVAGKFQFMITYNTTDNKSNTTTIDVPKINMTSVGKCAAKDNTLTATFYENFTLVFDFSGDDSNFWLKTISLTYPLGSPYFPKSKVNTTQTVSIMFDDSTKKYKASQSGSYLCNSETKLTLNSTVNLKMTDFQYAAFQKNITSFGDKNISECQDDAKTSSIVPIAVGAALAGLVVIVLIAYLIGRRRNRKGYESV
ncbi:Lysosome-associated membrane glycoprotein 1 [Mactra antiquata]